MYIKKATEEERERERKRAHTHDTTLKRRVLQDCPPNLRRQLKNELHKGLLTTVMMFNKVLRLLDFLVQ
jgi:hypothetical protein